jgi:E3 ubiquitin-protein ligase ATL6/9/15/31/42/55
MPPTPVFPSYNAFLRFGETASTKRRGMHGSCPICLSDFTCTGPVKDRIRVTIRYCKHTFHSGCLATWLQEYATCPMCRAKLFPRKEKCGGCGAKWRGRMGWVPTY